MNPREQAEALVKEGKLEEATASLKDAVRKAPADADLRVFLFQLMVILGEWDKAKTQLEVAAELNSANDMMARVCGAALLCEQFRDEVFAGKKTPIIFGEPEEWIGLMVEANRLFSTGAKAEAAEIRAKALDLAETSSGSFNGHEFEWIADADDRLGPIIEAIIDGKYYWIPFSRISSIMAEPPSDLRDLVWQPANFTWTTGGEGVGLICARYPGTHLVSDPDLRMARKTDFHEHEGGMYTAVGQRELVTDAGEYPVLEARHILIGDQPDPAAAESAAEESQQEA